MSRESNQGSPPPERRVPLGARLSRAVLPVFTALVVIYLFVPIAVMILFSFNDPRGRQNITWQGFTIENYFDIWSRPDITEPMVSSLIVAIIATVVATRVLSPIQAVLMAAFLNFAGALSGTAVATTVGKGIVEPGAVTQQLVISALLSAIAWNLLTWYYGIPSSSSHALVFSIVGAAVALAVLLRRYRLATVLRQARMEETGA